MDNWISANVDVHGTRLHYYRTGGPYPPLVLVHGITDDCMCWVPVAEVFSDQYDVIMIDLRGHGKSQAPQEGYTLENLATELALFTRVLDLERPIILGHSLGAITALILAGLYPDLPKSILLEDPPAFWVCDSYSPPGAETRSLLRAWMVDVKRKTHAELLDEVRENNPDWSKEEKEAWADSKQRFSPRIEQLIYPESITSVDFSELIPNITCPVLLISADEDCGASSSEEDILDLKAILPQLQVAHIADAGHCIRRDQFAQYIAALQQVL